MQKEKGVKKKHAYFKLLLLLIAIFLLLSWLGKLLELSKLDRARATRAEAEIMILELALKVYKENRGNYPPSLYPYLFEEREIPYNLKGKDKDPWGNEYIYAYPGLNIQSGFDLSSKGRDGFIGTPDDINNWDKERSWWDEYEKIFK